MESQLLYRNADISAHVELSIVIPTYKRAKYLTITLDSVFAQSNKDLLAYEIIVINNDPDDNMQEIIEKFRNEKIVVYSNIENYGQVGNINQGILLAEGKYVALLHDDDILFPSYFKVICGYIADRKRDYDCIVTSYYIFYEKYKLDLKHKISRMLITYRRLYRRKLQLLKKHDYIYAFSDVYNAPTCGTIFNKASLIEYGMFRDERGAAWDFYNFRRFHEHHDIYMLHRYVGARRMYSGMSNAKRIQEEFDRDDALLIEELKNNEFIGKYGETILTRKPIIKYCKYRLRKELYRYLHNLDGNRLITVNKFRYLRKREYM